MTDQEKKIFESIISKPKWYAGLRDKKGSFITAQSANRIKSRFEKGNLSEYYVKYIFNVHGWFKPEVNWENNNINSNSNG